MKKKDAVWWVLHRLFLPQKQTSSSHFYGKSDEEKGCRVVNTAQAVSPAKTMSYGTMLETFDSLQKGRNCVFSTNNRY